MKSKAQIAVELNRLADEVTSLPTNADDSVFRKEVFRALNSARPNWRAKEETLSITALVTEAIFGMKNDIRYLSKKDEDTGRGRAWLAICDKLTALGEHWWGRGSGMESMMIYLTELVKTRDEQAEQIKNQVDIITNLVKTRNVQDKQIKNQVDIITDYQKESKTLKEQVESRNRSLQVADAEIQRLNKLVTDTSRTNERLRLENERLRKAVVDSVLE